MARLDGRPGRRPRARPPRRCAMSSPSGRSIGPRSRCRSRAMCAAITAARSSIAKGGGTLVVTGPGDQEWRLPVTLDDDRRLLSEVRRADAGDRRLSRQIRARTPKGGKAKRRPRPTPAMTPTTRCDARHDSACGDFPFKKEAYRLPTFEVLLNAPADRFRSKANSRSSCLARYFAGGLVAERPSQMAREPVSLRLDAARPRGLVPVLDRRALFERRQVQIDARCSSATARPMRRRGARSASIRRSSRRRSRAAIRSRRPSSAKTMSRCATSISVVALPPFVLGVKTPRYRAEAGADRARRFSRSTPRARRSPGSTMTARLVKRNWSSMLQASDFSQGAAKYVTAGHRRDAGRAQGHERAARRRSSISKRRTRASISSSSRRPTSVGRRQKVSVDFFVGGDTPVTWARPPAQTADVDDRQGSLCARRDRDADRSRARSRMRARSPIVEEPGAGISVTTGSTSPTASAAISVTLAQARHAEACRCIS